MNGLIGNSHEKIFRHFFSVLGIWTHCAIPPQRDTAPAFIQILYAWMMCIADDHCGALPNGEIRDSNEPLLVGPGKVAFVIPDELLSCVTVYVGSQ